MQMNTSKPFNMEHLTDIVLSKRCHSDTQEVLLGFMDGLCEGVVTARKGPAVGSVLLAHLGVSYPGVSKELYIDTRSWIYLCYLP